MGDNALLQCINFTVPISHLITTTNSARSQQQTHDVEKRETSIVLFVCDIVRRKINTPLT